MSIKDERIKQIMNMIIKECIAKGELPTEKNVIDRFREYLFIHDPSKPVLEANYVDRGSEIDYKEANTSFDQIYSDLSLLYRRCLMLNSHIINAYALAEKQKAAMDNEYKKLEEEAKALIILKNSPTYLNCAFDSFCDFSKIDTANTTAEVDVSKHSASISYNKTKSTRINNACSIAVSYPEYLYPKNIVYSGKLSNMYDDYDNTIYDAKVHMDKNNGCIMEVTYDYGKNIIETNKLKMRFSTKTPMFVRVLYSPDGLNTFNLPMPKDFIKVNNEPVEVNFNSVKIKYIKFIIMKDSPDSVTTSGNIQDFIYSYTIKQIALFNLQHNDEALLQSIPITPVKSINNFAISKVSLSVDADIPSQTGIDYYVALEPKNGAPITWNQISPLESSKSEYPNIIDFMNRTTKSNIITSLENKKAEHELTALNTRGIKMYSIYNTSQLLSSAIVYKGKNYSLVKTMNASATAEIPDINSFKESTSSYYEITNGNTLNSVAKTTSNRVIFTSTNFINETANYSISIKPNMAFPTVIYINGKEVLNGVTLTSSSNNIPLKVGFNNITILSYVPANRDYSANIGLNLITTFGEVLAHDTPMTEVDLFELQNIVLSNDHSKYALYTINGITHIVVNDDHPTIKYKLSYSYKDQGSSTNLLFKAHLKRATYSNSTPVLYRYAIYCE